MVEGVPSAADRGVPYTSLVSYEMWKAVDVDEEGFGQWKTEIGSRGLPHLAKNERDMGHLRIRGRERNQNRKFYVVFMASS